MNNFPLPVSFKENCGDDSLRQLFPKAKTEVRKGGGEYNVDIIGSRERIQSSGSHPDGARKSSQSYRLHSYMCLQRMFKT